MAEHLPSCAPLGTFALYYAERLDAVGQLTGGVAHDFNNLLTVMLGNASLLTSGYARGVPDTQHANGHRIELLRKPYDRDALGTALRRALDT